MKNIFLNVLFIISLSLFLNSCEFKNKIVMLDSYLFSYFGKPIIKAVDIVDLNELQYDPALYSDKDIIVSGKVIDLDKNKTYMSLIENDSVYLVSMVYVKNGFLNSFNTAAKHKACRVFGKISNNIQGVQYLEAKSVYCK